MSRVELLPENAIITEIKEIQEDLNTIKNVQFSGRDTLKPIVNESGLAYDVVSEPSTPYWSANFNVYFTADTQPNPEGECLIVMYDMAGNELSASAIHINEVYRYPNSQRKNNYQLKFAAAADSLTQFTIKIFISATDTGSFVLGPYGF